MNRYIDWALGLAAVLAAGTAIPAQAQDTITLKFTQPFPESHMLWIAAGKPFTEVVTEGTGGKVKWETYHASQLGKDHSMLVGTGLADVGMIAPSYTPDKFPLSSVADLPTFYATTCEGRARISPLTAPGGIIHEAEYTPNGIRVLFVTQSPPYKLMTAKKQVNTPEDIKGLKIRAISLGQIESVSALGGVSVQVTAPEIYDSLARGTIDGVIYASVGMPPFDLEDVLKHTVTNLKFGSGFVAWGINQGKWDSLPADVQDVLTKAGEETSKAFCETYDREEQALFDKFAAENGHSFTKFSDADLASANEILATVPPKWVEAMESKGRAGKAVLDAYKASPTQ